MGAQLQIKDKSEHNRTGLSQLSGLFTRLGLTAFGRPAAHIAMMQKEVVEIGDIYRLIERKFSFRAESKQRSDGFVGQIDTTDSMKKHIFSVVVVFLGVLIGTPGCKKEHQSMEQGVIVGWNDGACATCGGFYINMSNDTVRGAASYYVLNWSDALLPVINQYSTQYHKDHLPIPVSFDSQPVSLNVPSAPADWIRVTAIQSR